MVIHKFDDFICVWKTYKKMRDYCFRWRWHTVSSSNRFSVAYSFNWDMRSAYLDTELMLIIDGEELNQEMRKAMMHYEQEAVVVLNETEYIGNYEDTMQRISSKWKNKIILLKVFRFLM